MIAQHALAIIWILLVGVTYSRLLRRKTDSPDNEQFRKLTIGSGVCLILAALIFWLSAFESYSVWFVPAMYSVLDWSRIILALSGGALVLWAIIQKLETVEPASANIYDQGSQNLTANYREVTKLGLTALNSLRVALSQPYPFAELARAALSGLSEVAGLPKGVLYVFNESTQEMTIVASKGLESVQERAFERLTLEGAILTEAFDTGQTMISADFLTLTTTSNLRAELVPGSHALLTPIIRNNQPLGLLALFTNDAPQLSKAQIATLSQMADIVADKFVNVKLRGELARAEKRGAEREETRKTLMRLFQAGYDSLQLAAVANGENLDGALGAMCQDLVGVGGANAVALIELDEPSASLNINARSIGFPEISEGFQRAAVQALKRQSLVLLSREKVVTGVEDKSTVEREPMALVAPIGLPETSVEGASGRNKCGLLFWNHNGRFYLGSEELQDFQDMMKPLSQILNGLAMQRKSQGTAEMMAVVRELLQPELNPITDKTRLKSFVSSVRKAFGLVDTCLVFKRTDNGQLRTMMSFGLAFEEVEQLVILAGEGSLGRSAALGASVFETGEERLEEAANEYDMLNRDVFGLRFERMGQSKPVAGLLIVPLTVNKGTRYVLKFFFADSEKAKSAARAILPLCHLLALVISVEELQAESDLNSSLTTDESLSSAGQSPTQLPATKAIVNDVNNDLLTIIGNCQLAAEDPNLSGAVDRLLQLVIDRAEHSAELIQGASQKASEASEASANHNLETSLDSSLVIGPKQNAVGAFPMKSDSKVSLTELLREFAALRVVGGQILLTEGKAREVEFDLQCEFTLNLASDKAEILVERLCHGLSALADEREIVTVSVYEDNSFVYLDICRRWRNLPATKSIGAYARFSSPPNRVFDIPTETLNILTNVGVEIALDQRSMRPAYVTLRNTRTKGTSPENKIATANVTTPRILAIDDQTMILDLLSAMCDSLGYKIDTFESPARAIAAFERGAHDIVITDVAMPNIDGWEVATAIKKLRPETYLIFITGWEEGLAQERLRSCDVNHVLKKPFRLEQLTEALLRAQRLSNPTAAS